MRKTWDGIITDKRSNQVNFDERNIEALRVRIFCKYPILTKIKYLKKITKQFNTSLKECPSRIKTIHNYLSYLYTGGIRLE